jgi:RND superfamily putative drug exporter
MSTRLYRLGRYAASHPWRVVGAWVIVAVVVIGAAATAGRQLEDSFAVPGLDSGRALELLESADSDQAGLTARVVATPLAGDASFLDAGEAKQALSMIRAALAQLPEVIDVSDPATTGGVSPDGRVAMFTVQYPVLETLDRGNLTDLKHALDELGDTVPLRLEAGGDLFFSFEEPGTSSAELIGVLAAMIILLLAFGSIIAMGLPIGLALFGLVLGVMAMPLVNHLLDIPSWTPQMASMIGLGVGIDYALFIVTRHREFLAQGMTVPEAAGRAVATAGQAVIFAGGTVVIAILGLAVAGVPFMTAAGVATSLIVAIMVVASVTLLPAFLSRCGTWINRLGLHAGRADSSTSVGWTRWGRHVSRHAWPYAIGATALLLSLAAPVLALELGFPDEGTQPETRTERRAYDLVADGFGPGSNGPLVIAVDTADNPAILESLSAEIAADAGIASVSVANVDGGSGVATLVAIPTTTPQDRATFETIQRLRTQVFPSVLADTGATAHIGGQTATFGDVADRVTARLPWFIGAVVVLSFLLLMVLFRSILVPLKAALLNLLSLGAAYGVLVMVFQWGWGKGLIGLESTVPIVSFIPMFMFAVLFGLSMDYEVFLLSRVREEYVAGGDNDGAVIRGIAGTARVITSAALIMICVFGGFVLGDDPVVKMLGLGLATAILVDATVVRVVLVPATMKLAGAANWWMPRWLDRILPHVDIDGVTELPDPDMASPANQDDDRELVNA